MVAKLLLFFIGLLSLQTFHSQLLELDSTNFNKTILAHPLILVSFSAPWCGHCQPVLAAFLESASFLQSRNSFAKLGIIDATLPINKDLVSDENVSGYPSIILYKNGNRITEYFGQRTTSEFLKYIDVKSGPPAVPVSTIEEIEMYCNKIHQDGVFGDGYIAVALGLFLPTEPSSGKGIYGKGVEVFNKVALKHDQTIFLLADNLNLVKHFAITRDHVIVFVDRKAVPIGKIPLETTSSDGINTLISDASLINSLISYSIPLTITYNSQMQQFIQSLPTKVHVLLFYHDNSPNKPSEQTLAFNAATESVAPYFRGKLMFIRIPSTEYQVLQFFDISESDLPKIIVADMTDPLNMKKFDYHFSPQNGMTTTTSGYHYQHQEQKREQEGNTKDTVKGELLWDTNKLHSFLTDYFVHKLTRTLSSESESITAMSFKRSNKNNVNDNVKVDGSHITNDGVISNANYNGGVISLVATNFRRIVVDDDSDVFVYFFSPSCAHCKSIEPVIAEVSKILVSDTYTKTNTIVAKIDGTKNEIDHPSVRIRGYPTFYFFRHGDKNNPIEYDGERSVQAILKFISFFGYNGGGVRKQHMNDYDEKTDLSHSTTDEL